MNKTHLLAVTGASGKTEFINVANICNIYSATWKLYEGTEDGKPADIEGADIATADGKIVRARETVAEVLAALGVHMSKA